MKPLVVLGVLTALAGGCAGDSRSVAPGRAARPGDHYVVLLRESAPEGVRETREVWSLRDTLGGVGDFDVRRGEGAARFDRRALVPPPVEALTRATVPGWAKPPEFRMETVRVPAGRFRCRRTSRTYDEHSGRVMRVDEWWSPAAPMAVQRWTRWQGLPETLLREPPRRPQDMILGSEWDVLAEAPAR